MTTPRTKTYRITKRRKPRQIEICGFQVVINYVSSAYPVLFGNYCLSKRDLKLLHSWTGRVIDYLEQGK